MGLFFRYISNPLDPLYRRDTDVDVKTRKALGYSSFELGICVCVIRNPFHVNTGGLTAAVESNQ